MIEGKKIYLTGVEKEDIRQLLLWRNREDFRKHFREYRELNMSQQERWFQDKVLNDPTTLMFAIHRKEDGLLLGCCGLVYINFIHGHADLSLYIGWNDSYIDGEGYAKESCELLFDYAFKSLRLNKVWTEIYTFDNKKKELYDAFGMKVDGLLRQNYFYDGRWWDSYIMSILSSDWIEMRKTKKAANN